MKTMKILKQQVIFGKVCLQNLTSCGQSKNKTKRRFTLADICRSQPSKLSLFLGNPSIKNLLDPDFFMA